MGFDRQNIGVHDFCTIFTILEGNSLFLTKMFLSKISAHTAADDVCAITASILYCLGWSNAMNLTSSIYEPSCVIGTKENGLWGATWCEKARKIGYDWRPLTLTAALGASKASCLSFTCVFSPSFIYIKDTPTVILEKRMMSSSGTINLTTKNCANPLRCSQPVAVMLWMHEEEQPCLLFQSFLMCSCWWTKKWCRDLPYSSFLGVLKCTASDMTDFRCCRMNVVLEGMCLFNLGNLAEH